MAVDYKKEIARPLQSLDEIVWRFADRSTARMPEWGKYVLSLGCYMSSAVLGAFNGAAFKPIAHAFFYGSTLPAGIFKLHRNDVVAGTAVPLSDYAIRQYCRTARPLLLLGGVALMCRSAYDFGNSLITGETLDPLTPKIFQYGASLVFVAASMYLDDGKAPVRKEQALPIQQPIYVRE